MPEYCYPFRGFPDQCYLTASTNEEEPTIKDLRPTDYDYWLNDEKDRLYWQFRRLKGFRIEKIAAASNIATYTTNTRTEQSTTTFHPFSRLPTEIRLEIFSLISGGYKRPRVHRISNRPDTPLEFISNQSISPLLHICRESRNEFLIQSECTLAFQTYVNFSCDIFYFMDTNGFGDFLRLATLLNHREARLIKKLALRSALFQHVSHLIPERMNEIEELMVVFEEWKGWEETWKGGEVKFVSGGNIKRKKPKQEDDLNRTDVRTLILEMAQRRVQSDSWWTVNSAKNILFSVGVVEKIE